MPYYPPSHRFARLIGPSLMAVSLTESLNAHIWTTSTPPLIFLNGSILFISGLTILQHHNLWRRDWRVLVTLVGWSNLTIGFLRMALPERMLDRVRTVSIRNIRIATSITATVGCVLTLMGYFPSLSQFENLGR